MQQIADWLEKLGMSEYTERFAENGINVAALPHLTDQDLKDIGVLLGHRRIISKLAGAAAATPEPTAQVEPKPQDTAERRLAGGRGSRSRPPPWASRYSTKNSHTSASKIAFQRRMAEALCYREQGLNYEQIGARLKCHPANACKLVTKAMDRIIMEPARRVLGRVPINPVHPMSAAAQKQTSPRRSACR
jgi:hypothetical protein